MEKSTKIKNFVQFWNPHCMQQAAPVAVFLTLSYISSSNHII